MKNIRNAFRPEQWPAVLLALLSCVAVFYRLGQGTLHDWDEAIYAEIAKEMVNTGRWLGLQYGYHTYNDINPLLINYIDKPPLLMWMTSLFYDCFGINEFWSRAASALGGVGLVCVTYSTGKLLYDKWTGFVAGLLLLASFAFLKFSRSGMTDILLTLWIMLTLHGYLRVKAGSASGWYVVGGAIAFGVMTKSIGILVAPAALLVDIIVGGTVSNTLRSKYFWRGVAIGLGIVLPWHLAMIVLYGSAFIDAYLLFHVAHANHPMQGAQGGFYYLGYLYEGFFPWSLVAPFALVWAFAGARRQQIMPLLLLGAVVFTLYTISMTKLPWYVMPLYPIMSLFTAAFIVRGFVERSIGALAVLAMATCFLSLDRSRLFLSAVAVFIVIIALVALLRRQEATQCGLILFSVGLLGVSLRHIAPLYHAVDGEVAPLAKLAKTRSREPLYISKEVYRPSPQFYSDREVIEVPLDNSGALPQMGVELICKTTELSNLATHRSFSLLAEEGRFSYVQLAELKTP